FCLRQAAICSIALPPGSATLPGGWLQILLCGEDACKTPGRKGIPAYCSVGSQCAASFQTSGRHKKSNMSITFGYYPCRDRYLFEASITSRIRQPSGNGVTT